VDGDRQAEPPGAAINQSERAGVGAADHRAGRQAAPLDVHPMKCGPGASVASKLPIAVTEYVGAYRSFLGAVV